jgi:hypothetical protein
MSIDYSDVSRNNEVDEFITPFQLALETVKRMIIPHPSNIRVLDAGANKGVWGQAFRAIYPNAFIVGVELMDMPKPESYDAWYGGTDFLTWDCPVLFDIVIGNPPYSCRLTGKRQTIVDKFIMKDLQCLQPRAPLYQLLRANFAHAKGRYTKGIFKDNAPAEEWKCMPRPSFYEEDERIQRKSTNAHDYSVYYFINGVHHHWCKTTPFMWR